MDKRVVKAYLFSALLVIYMVGSMYLIYRDERIKTEAKEKMVAEIVAEYPGEVYKSKKLYFNGKSISLRDAGPIMIASELRKIRLDYEAR